MTQPDERSSTAVLDVRGMLRASEKQVVEAVLMRRPGVERVEANPVAQTATVEYDPATTSVKALQEWVEECGYHCSGRSVPGHVCDPLAGFCLECREDIADFFGFVPTVVGNLRPGNARHR